MLKICINIVTILRHFYYIYHWLVFCTLWINRNNMHCKLTYFTTGYYYIKLSHSSVSDSKLSYFSQTFFGKGLIKVELFFHSLSLYSLTCYIYLLIIFTYLLYSLTCYIHLLVIFTYSFTLTFKAFWTAGSALVLEADFLTQFTASNKLGVPVGNSVTSAGDWGLGMMCSSLLWINTCKYPTDTVLLNFV